MDIVKKPGARSERVRWLIRKLGTAGASGLMYSTDREVKGLFNRLFPIYKDAPDYKEEINLPLCLRCGSEVTIIWECRCTDTGPILDPDEYELWRKERGEQIL